MFSHSHVYVYNYILPLFCFGNLQLTYDRVPIMEETDTIEYLAMRNTRPKLITGLQFDMNDLASSLNIQGLIDDTCYEIVTQFASPRTEVDKAEEMAKALIKCVKNSREKFNQFLKILSERRSHHDLEQILKNEYSRIGKRLHKYTMTELQ